MSHRAQGKWKWSQSVVRRGRGGGVGTRPWWLALLACGGAYWPLALEPSAMTSGHPYYCGHPHCRGHPHCLGGGRWMPGGGGGGGRCALQSSEHAAHLVHHRPPACASSSRAGHQTNTPNQIRMCPPAISCCTPPPPRTGFKGLAPHPRPRRARTVSAPQKAANEAFVFGGAGGGQQWLCGQQILCPTGAPDR